MDVAGVDGCPGGWVIAQTQAHRLLHVSISLAPTFRDVLGRTAHCAAVAVDIPIGLSENDRRAADVESRAVLRPFRHSSVFPAPIRPVLNANSYAEANTISERLHRHARKISKQTWMLVPKIADVDRAVTAEDQSRVVEVHPEVCFWAMNGCAPLEHQKRTAAGRAQRLALLADSFAEKLEGIESPARADDDDVLDACAAAWTAARFARGEAQRFPAEPELDARGLRMEIVY
jgi:predicted RNase H-like nuclease